MIWFLFGMAFGSVITLLVLAIADQQPEPYVDEHVSMNMRQCPPCTGKCNQGRNCPER